MGAMRWRRWPRPAARPSGWPRRSQRACPSSRTPASSSALRSPSDLALAGVAEFHDLDRLTIFADNLVPHVLRVDGVLRYDPALAARIDAGELIPPGDGGDRDPRLRRARGRAASPAAPASRPASWTGGCGIAARRRATRRCRATERAPCTTRPFNGRRGLRCSTSEQIRSTSAGSSVTCSRSRSPGEIFHSPCTRWLQPVEQPGPIGAAHEHDREVADLPGLDQGERLEQLVERAEAAREDHERARVADEHDLAREEVVEAQRHACPRRWLTPGLIGEVDVQPDRKRPAVAGALVRRPP